jgi:integrase
MRHLYSFKGFYYFRSRVPSDLQGLFQCRMIKKALRTADFKTATSSVKLMSNGLDRVIKVIRSGILTDEQREQLVREFFQNFLQKSEEFKAGSKFPNDEGFRENLIAFFDSYIERLKGYLFDNAERVEGFVDRFLERKEIPFKKESVEYKKLRREFIKALIEYFKVEKERFQGNYNNWYDDLHSVLKKKELPQQIQSAKQKKGHLLSEVIQEYTKEKIQNKEWNDKNREETLTFYKQLIEILGDKDIKDFSRNELLDYQGLLIKFPANIKKRKELRDLPLAEIISLIQNDDLPPCRIISTKTVNKNLIRVNAIFEYAKERGYSTVNPAFKLKVSSKGDKESEEKDLYTSQDIEKLLNSPVYKRTNTGRPERFWIPLIGLYSGLRLGEICQLYKDDIKEEFGIPYFDINKNTEDKSLKTKSSKRLVPISPLLIKLGFLSYVNSVKTDRLWNNLQRRRDGYGHDFSRWYNDYEGRYITDHPKKSFHSLRHSFINSMKQEIVKDKAFGLENVLGEIVGHSNESITLDRYGKEYLLQTKLDLIQRLDYGIKLSHLKFP